MLSRQKQQNDQADWILRLPEGPDCSIGYSSNEAISFEGPMSPGRENEDRHYTCIYQDKTQLYMVLDGHDGTKAVEFALKQIPHILLESQLAGGDQQVIKALRNAIVNTEREFFISIDPYITRKVTLQMEIEQKAVDSSTALKLFPTQIDEIGRLDELIKGGTTAVVALIHENRLYVTNIGNSRALLCLEGKDDRLIIEQLSVDHNASNTDELCRLERCSLDPNMLRRNSRLGMQQNTRSIGDYSIKEGYKNVDIISHATSQPGTAEPYIHEPISLSGVAGFLILMSDGLYEAYQAWTDQPENINDDIGYLVAKELKVSSDLKMVAQNVVNKVKVLYRDTCKRDRRSGRLDDITLIIKNFGYPSSLYQPPPQPLGYSMLPSSVPVYSGHFEFRKAWSSFGYLPPPPPHYLPLPHYQQDYSNSLPTSHPEIQPRQLYSVPVPAHQDYKPKPQQSAPPSSGRPFHSEENMYSWQSPQEALLPGINVTGDSGIGELPLDSESEEENEEDNLKPCVEFLDSFPCNLSWDDIPSTVTEWVLRLPEGPDCSIGYSLNEVVSFESPMSSDRENEDRHYTCIYQDKTQLYMVLDGHDGTKAVKFALKQIPHILLKSQLAGGDQQVIKALRNAIVNTERKFFISIDPYITRKVTLQMEIEQKAVDSSTALKLFPTQINEIGRLDELIKGGTTAVVALIHENRLYVTNIGNSRALLCLEGKDDRLTIEQLSVDHNTSNTDELHRLERCGLDPNMLRRNGRLGTQHNTRSIGDYSIKEGYKNVDIISHATSQPGTAEPYIHEPISLSGVAGFLILMSDGLYEAYEAWTSWPEKINDYIGYLVAKELKVSSDLKMVAQNVVNKVKVLYQDTCKHNRRSGRLDDITLIIKNFGYPSSQSKGIGISRQTPNLKNNDITEENEEKKEGDDDGDNVDEGETEEDFIKGIENAIAKSGGKINRKLAHVMFVGPPGSGKSSLMDRLLGKLRAKFSASTGVCNSIVIVDINTANPSTFHSVTMTDTDTWEEIDCPSSFIRQMSQGDSITSGIETLPTIEEEATQSEELDVSIEGSTESTVTSQAELAYISSTDVTTQPQRSEPLETEYTAFVLPVSKATPLTIEALIKKYGRKDFNFLEKTSSLYLRDTGGQVEFQEMLALLISGPSIFIFVFRADLDFKSKFEVQYRKSANESLNSYTSSITTEEALLQCLASVYAMDTSSDDIVKMHQPLVFIVATHIDKLGSDREAKVSELNQLLHSTIKKNGFSHLVQYADERNTQVLFEVDNISENEDSFRLFRSRVNSLVNVHSDFNIEYPISYLFFCLELQEINKSILSFKECEDLAKSHRIVGKEQVLHLLRFLHIRIGLIRYFNVPGLQHIIVREPQVLFNKTTDLIIKTFSSKSLLPGQITDFEKKGILMASAFESVMSGCDQISPREFLQLLVHLRITAPFQIAGDQERYFVPCVLNHVPESTKENPETDVLPLCVKFKCNHCPKGIYGILVTHLMRPEKEDQSTTFTLIEDEIYKDQVSFEIQSFGFSNEITLNLLISHLEISFIPYSPEAPINKICNDLRMIIEKSISRSLQDLHYKKEKVGPVVCFKCEHCSELHPVTEHHRISCKKSHKDSRIPPSGRYWYNEGDDNTGSTGNTRATPSQTSNVGGNFSNVPAASLTGGVASTDDDGNRVLGMDDLGDVVFAAEALSPRWKELSLKLRLRPTALKIIEKNYPHDVVGCYCAALEEWLKLNYEHRKHGKPSWKKLAEAVRTMDGRVHEEIVKKYGGHVSS